jgi:hypothetical protein
MIIDSHMHLIRKKNFDPVTYERLWHQHLEILSKVVYGK